MALLNSVNVGLPREVTLKDQAVTTSIFKSPVHGPVVLRRHNLEGDRQADLKVHGGPSKAVYVYPARHYDYWRTELEDTELDWGSFGENFTVDGVDEQTVSIGDEFRVGSARLVVTQPRMPCFKLGIRLERPDIVTRFLESRRTGFYFGVVEEGLVQAGDRIERLAEHPDGLRVTDVTTLYTTQTTNEALLLKAISLTVLPEHWRAQFKRHLERLRE